MESHQINKELSNKQPPFDCADVLTPWTCKNCTNFKTHKLVHLKKHHRMYHKLVKLKENKYKCVTCKFQTDSNFSFLRHKLFKMCPKNPKKRRSASDQTKPQKCKLCPYETSHAGYLKYHILRKHTSLERIKWFKCDQCPYQSKVEHYLEQHMWRKHNETLKVRESIWTEHSYSKMELPTELQEERWCQCKQCPYRTNNCGNLKQHIRNVHCTDVLTCEYCRFKTNNQTKLRHHVTLRHNPDNLPFFKCEHCTYECAIRQVLRRHTINVHINKSHFECDKCEVKTISKQYLKNHILRKHKET